MNGEEGNHCHSSRYSTKPPDCILDSDTLFFFLPFSYRETKCSCAAWLTHCLIAQTHPPPPPPPHHHPLHPFPMFLNPALSLPLTRSKCCSTSGYFALKPHFFLPFFLSFSHRAQTSEQHVHWHFQAAGRQRWRQVTDAPLISRLTVEIIDTVFLVCVFALCRPHLMTSESSSTPPPNHMLVWYVSLEMWHKNRTISY